MEVPIKTFPTLYSKSKTGKTIQWNAVCYSLLPSNWAQAHISWGYVGCKQLTTKVSYLQGKFIGRKNETTAIEQCIIETKKKWQSKKDKENYSESMH